MIHTLNKKTVDFIPEIRRIYFSVVPKLTSYYPTTLLYSELKDRTEGFFKKVAKKAYSGKNLETEILNSPFEGRNIYFLEERGRPVSVLEINSEKRSKLIDNDFVMSNIVFVNWLLANPQGKGYGSNLLMKYLDIVSEREDVDVISLHCHEDNPALRLYEKSGFKLDAYTHWNNINLYSIFNTEKGDS